MRRVSYLNVETTRMKRRMVGMFVAGVIVGAASAWMALWVLVTFIPV